MPKNYIMRKDRNKSPVESKTVRQYVDEQIEKKKLSKFESKIYELMLDKPNDEYTYEWLEECFKKARTMTECEMCTQKGKQLLNNTMYCEDHS